jgi:hypothetical protein
MTTEISYPNASDISPNDYIVIGLATCFFKEDGEVHQIEVIEPIPSASLEAILKGIPTSYKLACAITLGAIVDGDNLVLPEGFPETAQFAEDFVFRAFAAVRTYKRRESAQLLIPLGSSTTDLKYSIERKRILNAARVITKEDNIKQHSHTHKVL